MSYIQTYYTTTQITCCGNNPFPTGQTFLVTSDFTYLNINIPSKDNINVAAKTNKSIVLQEKKKLFFHSKNKASQRALMIVSK